MPFTTSNTRNIYYHVESPAESAKYTLFFIHGLGSSSSFYFSIIPHLRSLSIPLRLVLMDTYSHSSSRLSSTDPCGKDITIQTIVEDVLNVLKDVRVHEKVILIGHSMGAIVANTFASKYPELLSGLILISAVNPAPSLEEAFQKRIKSIETDGNLENIAATVPKAATGPSTNSLQHAFIRALILSTSTEGYTSLCRAIAEAKEPEYSKINLPVLMLAGESDYVVPLSTSQAILASYGTSDKDKKLEVLEGVGHWPLIECAERVGKFIGDFTLGLDG